MSYTNSPLIMGYVPSPHYSARVGDIQKITVHHTGAVTSAKKVANHFYAATTRASANYVIGQDGEIIMCLPEKCRAWATKNPVNDNLAVNIEVCNSSPAPDWEISEKAWTSLVALCVDICKRNRIEKLTYTGGPSGTLTLHRFFVATECPGPYLMSKMPELAELVNQQLHPTRIMSIVDVPAYAQPAVQRLLDAGYLQGTDSGLDLSLDMVRILVVLDRILGRSE